MDSQLPTPGLRRHQLWRLQYRRRRYLEHVTDEDLAQRMRDITCNLTELTIEGKIGLRPLEDTGAKWIEAFTHVLEEYSLRNAGIPSGLMKGAVLPRPTWPRVPKAAALLNEARFDPARHLVKFGKSEHMKLAVEGRWRIAPASSYGDPSLGPARYDSELKRTKVGLQGEVGITILDRYSGLPKQRTHPLGNLTVTEESTTDYYVICLSKALSPRLFDDFGYDSCVIIRNVRAFAERIFKVVRKLLPDWHGRLREVTYFDPINPPLRVDFYFSKHFRYAYQQEVRFAWLPSTARSHLVVHEFNLGSVTDICDFLTLAQH